MYLQTGGVSPWAVDLTPAHPKTGARRAEARSPDPSPSGRAYTTGPVYLLGVGVREGRGMAGRGHNGAAWRAMRTAVLSADPLVCFCGRAIDKRLRWPHPGSPTVDLIVPWSRGGDPLNPANLRPAHLWCNTSRGAGRTPVRRQWTSVDTP